jgi:hypothetical protein
LILLANSRQRFWAGATSEGSGQTAADLAQEQPPADPDTALSEFASSIDFGEDYADGRYDLE